MDEFQLTIMANIINAPGSTLSNQQFEQFSKELWLNSTHKELGESKLAKKLRYKIDKSNLVRGYYTASFMQYMN